MTDILNWIMDSIRAYGAWSVFAVVIIQSVIVPIASPLIIMGAGFILISADLKFFEALMPTLVIDEQTLAPLSLGLNNRRHTELHRRHALRDLGYPVWGMSPSSSFQGSGYSEYGVPALGSAGYRVGVVTPHASALALVIDPNSAIANLRQLATRYPVYGEFGFYDAVDPLTGRVAYKYLALDQAMIFLAVANYLKDGIIQRDFAADPIAARVLPMIGKEKFFE